MANAQIDVTNLGEVIGAAVAQGIAAIAPRHEIKEGDPEYVARQRAEGWFDTFDGGVKVFQNAYEAQPRGESEETRYRAAHLKPGKYIVTKKNPSGRVTVEVDGQGVHLKYPVSGDAMMENKDYWRSFSELIDKIWWEMNPTAT